jgi:hypothetical protein
MSTSDTPPPGTPPPTESQPPLPPSPNKGFPKGVLIALVSVLVGGAVAGAFVLGRRSGSSSGTSSGTSEPTATGPQGTPSAGATVEGKPPPPAPKPLTIYGDATPAVWVDVYAPGKVRQALVENRWLQEQMKKPLGQGFASSWAAFFGSSGEDLQASFKGAVFDVVAGQLLDSPFRALWFAGPSDANAPVFIVPSPNSTAVAAYEAMEKVAERGGFTASACPSAGTKVPEGGFKISRWVVAEHSLYVGRTEDRLVVARQPPLVLRGLCAVAPKLEAPKGVDLELGFDSEVLGREMAFLTHALSLDNGTRLQFAAEGSKLVGRGIAGPLMDKVRLDAASLSDDLLRLVPAETPVLLALQLKLPESLEGAKVKAYWEGEDPGQVRTRQVAIVWTPRGDAALDHEFAILWGRTEDATALKSMFNGGNPLVHETLCKHQVMASSQQVLDGLRKACEGKSPNLLNAAGPVVAGLRAPGSVTIGVNMGQLLSQLLADGYWSEQQLGKKAPVPGSAPPEIEAARSDLEALPYVGLRGTVDGDSLVPGGFGS